MNKIFVLLTATVLVLSVSFTVYASNSQGTGSEDSKSQKTDVVSENATQNGQGTQENKELTTPSTQNQNQVKTQNQGDEQQLQVTTQEQQGDDADTDTNSTEDKNTSGKKQGLTEVRSSVSQQIQKMLSTDSAQGGIGEQVREWARVQNQSQLKIQEHLTKIEEKQGLARTLFGSDSASLDELKKEMAQNRVRVQQLEQLKLELANQSEITDVQEMIALMQLEDTALKDKVFLEESDTGLLGWFVRLFAN